MYVCIYTHTHTHAYRHLLAYIMPHARVIKEKIERSSVEEHVSMRKHTFYYYILVGSTSINSVISITSRRKRDSQKREKKEGEKERKETKLSSKGIFLHVYIIYFLNNGLFRNSGDLLTSESVWIRIIKYLSI